MHPKMNSTCGDDDVKFSGSQANLEGAAENLFHLLHTPNPYVLKHD